MSEAVSFAEGNNSNPQRDGQEIVRSRMIWMKEMNRIREEKDTAIGVVTFPILKILLLTKEMNRIR